MRVILIRHGEADGEEPEGLGDAGRALTRTARIALPTHFESLAARIGPISVIFCSPLVRAVQTATILAQSLRFDGKLRANRVLVPDGPVGAIEALLETHLGETVVLVGHNPSVGATAAHFLGQSGLRRTVTPGTVIGIERPDSHLAAGKLLFWAVPGQPVSEEPLAD